MKRKNKIRLVSIILTVVMTVTLLSGCGDSKEEEKAETISVYLWSNVLYNNYAPYIQSQLPDINIEFVVGNNDLDFYKFMKEHGQLPDIITCRRFSRHDAVGLKDQLMDLSTTEEAGAIYDSYLKDFTNIDGTVNWLPICATADGIVANIELFDEYGIPLPTDYDSMIDACKAFEEVGIRGFVSDFSYDYTCMEILQGLSISEIMSAEGSEWRAAYEDPEDETSGLDDVVWPGVFERMEQFIKDANIQPEDTELDYDPVINMFTEGKVAMIRLGSTNTVWYNNDGIEGVFLPYYGRNGEEWILTYPEFQVAVNKDLEKDKERQNKAMKVLGVMLSESAQNVLSQNQDVITYNQNVDLELSPYLENLRPIIQQNHLYNRIASNDFFAVSQDVVTKMIQGEYDAKQAYQAFDEQLRQSEKVEEETILKVEKDYSNIFYTDGGNEAYSVMANTLREAYGSDVLLAAGYSFTGCVVKGDYTEKQAGNMIMPNALESYHGEMTGKELKELVRAFVEGGVEGGFTPFNRGSLPVTSGISIQVQQKDGAYSLLGVKKDGKDINDEDIYKVSCLHTEAHMNPVIEAKGINLEKAELRVRDDWNAYIKDGGKLVEPEEYITLEAE